MDNLNGDPKTVPGGLLDDDGDLSKLTKNTAVEVIGGLLQGVFFAIGTGLQHEHWFLSDKDAVELGKALYDFLKGLPKKQSQRFDKFLKEYAPSIKLFMVGSVILAPKVGASMQLAQLKKQNERSINRTNEQPFTAADTATGFSGFTDDFVAG